jgi:hypothetical protein
LAGRISWDARGQATIRLAPGLVHAENVAALVKALSSALELAGSTAAKPGA